MNAFNMYDGINLQSVFYLLLFFLVFSIKGIDSFFFFPRNVGQVPLYYNYKNTIYLSNIGSYFLSYLISIYLI